MMLPARSVTLLERLLAEVISKADTRPRRQFANVLVALSRAVSEHDDIVLGALHSTVRATTDPEHLAYAWLDENELAARLHDRAGLLRVVVRASPSKTRKAGRAEPFVEQFAHAAFEAADREIGWRSITQGKNVPPLVARWFFVPRSGPGERFDRYARAQGRCGVSAARRRNGDLLVSLDQPKDRVNFVELVLALAGISFDRAALLAKLRARRCRRKTVYRR